MNNETMKLVAQFTIRARKIIGAVDIKQLTSNSAYQEEVFKKVDELADEELLMTSLALRAQLRGVELPNIQNAAPAPVVAAPESDSGKYVFGARG